MPKAARLGDIASGHGCFPPTPITSGSGDVLINGIPAARVGDSVAPHGCKDCPPHGRNIAAGSATVFINGKPAARLGDAISCGGSVNAGSGNVFIGDSGSPLSLVLPMPNSTHSHQFNIQIQFKDGSGNSLSNMPFTAELERGSIIQGITDDSGATDVIAHSDKVQNIKVAAEKYNWLKRDA
ncbi:MAG: type VI secretion system PAAR protein [Amphritea sp.]